MAEDIAAYLVARADQLDSDDSTWRTHMADIAEVMRPLRAELSGTKGSAGAKRMDKVFDGTAIHALQNLSSGLYGSASNPAESWFSLSIEDKDRAKWGPIRDWLDRHSNRVLASFGPAYSGFYAQAPSLYLDLAGFGTGIFSSELRQDHSGFVDMSRSLSTHNFDVDNEGSVNTMFVRRRLSADNAAMEFGKENLSPKLQAKVGEKEKYEAEFIQAVLPNGEYMRGMLGFKGQEFASYTIECDTKHVVKRKGFMDFPYFVPRWEVAECERKGRGPGEMALPDTRSLNAMTKGNLEAGQMSGKPPWGAVDELQGSSVKLQPGKITYGAVDRQGNQLLKPLMSGGGTPFSLEMANQLRNAIKDYFYSSLIDLEGRTGLANLEYIERTEQQQRLMAPYHGRIQTEFLSKIVMRRLRLLAMVRNVMDPPPPDMQGHAPQVEFVSSAALAQKSARGAGVMRFYQAKQLIVGDDPMAGARVDNDKALQIAAEAFSVPQLLNDDETTEKNRAAIQQQLQAKVMAEVAKPMADAAHKGAQAMDVLRGGNKAAA
jgi:hypothetical protein